MNMFSQLFSPAQALVEHRVGTPDQPLELPALPRVKTGTAGQKQIAAIMANLSRDPERYADASVPLNDRANRRAERRAEARRQRKGQRAYVRQEWAKEREASDLANLFALARAPYNPSRPLTPMRAEDAIQQRILHLRAPAQADYDRAWAARQRNRELPPPKPIPSHDYYRDQLREIAKAAR